jgi:16S rRNA (cytidine1402-2'-O)-methyltransferase
MNIDVQDKIKNITYNLHMGTLYVVATPIGNLEDITIRAIKVLLSVPVIICEDTRRTGQLIKILKEKYSRIISTPAIENPKYVSVRDWNEVGQIAKVLETLLISDSALVSDAGTPLISDPGYKVIRAAKESGINVVPVPGASAVTAVLSAAGLPTDKFLFLGYLSKKWEIPQATTTVVYESPKRVSKTLEDIKARYPNAQIVIAREMTKIFEYIGPDDGKTTRGEVTVLVYIPKE